MNLPVFLGSFLDGFTGAGLTRRVALSDEPILGFAPVKGTFSETYHGQYWQINFGKRKVKVQVLDARIDAPSGNLTFLIKSTSGKVREVRVETESGSPNLASAFESPAR